MMELTLPRTKKIRISREDALGGALPLIVMHKSAELSEIKEGASRSLLRAKRKRKKGSKNYVLTLFIVAISAAAVSALLAEGPKF